MKKIKVKFLASMLACSVFCGSLGINPTVANAANIANYYTKDNESLAVTGGTLKSHIEHQTYGTLSGKSRKVKFYVYASYSGSKNVDSIKCSWTIGAKMRNSATLTATVGIKGTTYEASASYSTSWQNCKTEEKYWLHTSGTKVSYEDSNFVISPDSDLKGYEFWMNSTATVKVKGDKKYYTISTAT